MPVAVLVTCGAPLTRRVGDLAAALGTSGWDTYVVGTPASAGWIDQEHAAALPVYFDFRAAGERKRIPAADVVAVCPATFNTVNKVVAGIADNYATSLVCEALGAGVPLVVAPMVNQKLWAHLQWSQSLTTLQRANVRLLDLRTGSADVGPVESGTGEVVVDAFQATWLLTAMQDAVSAS